MISRLSPSLSVSIARCLGWKKQPQVPFVWLASLSDKPQVGFHPGGAFQGCNNNSYHSLAHKRWIKREEDRNRRKSQQQQQQSMLLLDPIPQSSLDYKALTMPLSCREMDNSALLLLSEMGNYDARVEVLKRHIMACDHVSYEVAEQTFQLISAANRKYMWLFALPYQIGVVTAVTAGVVSIPLCFHYPTVAWFNEYYVTADVPEPKDLETFLEVGSWAWNWMEPLLGQISFVLLCLQFSRAQIANLGIRPYTQKMKQLRGRRLAKQFPQYNAKILNDFTMADNFVQDN